MKTFLISLTVYLVLINPLTVDSVFALENKKLEVVSNLDLKKFQGKFNVLEVLQQSDRTIH